VKGDFYIGITIVIFLGLVSYLTRALTIEGIVAATILGITVLLFAGLKGFTILVAFLVIASAATFVGKKHKESLKTLDSKDFFGRSGYNVMSNGIVALLISLLYSTPANPNIINIAYAASIAGVLADTLGSEIGTLSNKAYLITNFKRVPPGTNGGISLLGTTASLIGALVIGGLSVMYGSDVYMIIAITIGGFIGSIIDSLVGATLENAGKIDKGGVNILCSATAAGSAVLLYLIF